MWIVAREVYVLITPDFVPTIQPLLFGAGEIAIGVFCIAILRRKPEAAQAYSNTGAGAAVGDRLDHRGHSWRDRRRRAWLWRSAFSAAASSPTLTHMSCFEGACGYFAFFIGLFAMLAGAIAGGIFAVWCVNRRRPVRPS